MRVGWKQALVDADPHTNTLGSDQRLLDSIYRGLTKIDPKTLQPTGELARSWKTSRDGLTWTFKLRSGLHFHDGQPLQAADVKYSIERIMDPKTKATVASEFSAVRSVEAKDPLTVVFHLKNKYGLLATALAIPTWSAIVPRNSGPTLRKHPDGAGPFKWTKLVPNTSLTLSKFDGYWDKGKPKLDQLVFQFTPDANSELQALQSQQLDFIDAVPLEQVKALGSQSGIRVVNSPRGGTVNEFGFNVRQKPFDDVRVRRAIAMAIDKKQLARAATFGLGKPVDTMVPPASSVPVKVEGLPYDPQKSRQLLAEAGVRNLKLSFSPCGGTSFPDMVRASQVIVSDLKKIGIDASTRTEEAATWADEVISKHQFQAFMCGLVGGADPDTATFRYFRSDGAYNFSGFKPSPQLDELMLKGRQLQQPAERARIYDRVWTQLAQQAPWIPLYSVPQVVGMQDSVAGYQPLPDSFGFENVGFAGS